MAIIIPEILIKDNYEILIKKIYTNLKSLEQVGTVAPPTDNGTTFIFNVTALGAVGTPQVIDITCVDGSILTVSSYFSIYTTYMGYFVWYRIDGIGVIPNITNRKGILVNIDSTDTDEQVAFKTQIELNKIDSFSIARANEVLTITNVETDASKRSLLYQIFGDLKFDGMSYFQQCKRILEHTFESGSRSLDFYLGYNTNREGFPMINILLPSEENDPKNVGNVQASTNFYDGSGADLKTNNYSVTYNLVITSDNENDVIILYHFLKSLTIMGYEQFTSGCGFQNLYTSGRDIMLDFDIDPMNTFHRTLALSFFYENEIPDLFSSTDITGFNFNGTIN